MDARGECCIARYAGGPYDMAKVDRIMLKFRPIAPKPAVSRSTPEKIEAFVGGRRGKRRYVRCNNNNNNNSYNNNNNNKSRKCSRKKNKAPVDVMGEAVVTLPLLPETPDPKASEKRETANDDVCVDLWRKGGKYAQMWSSFGLSDQEPAVMKDPVKESESCVTVESMTDTPDEKVLEKRETANDDVLVDLRRNEAKYAPMKLSFGSSLQEPAAIYPPVRISESCVTEDYATGTHVEKVLEKRATANDVGFVDLWRKEARYEPMWLGFGLSDQKPAVVHPPAVKISESFVTVECVTERWMDVKALGSTDEERKMNLDKDTCPSFISDGSNNVTWTNAAYREMVVGKEEAGEEETKEVVWLVMKESEAVRVRLSYHSAFSCRVRMKYTCRKEMNSVVLPCDVWRMNNGGFAWRLDVKAALCLGR